MKKIVFAAAGICLLAAAVLFITTGCRGTTAPDAGLSEAGQSMKDAAETVKDKMKNELSTAADKVSEGASKIGEKASEKISDANDALEEGVTRLGEAMAGEDSPSEAESSAARP